MKSFLSAVIALLVFIGLYSVPEIPMKEPIVHYVGEPDVTVVEDGYTCKIWSVPMFSNQRAKEVCDGN
jgi:hypothetical protein